MSPRFCPRCAAPTLLGCDCPSEEAARAARAPVRLPEGDTACAFGFHAQGMNRAQIAAALRRTAEQLDGGVVGLVHVLPDGALYQWQTRKA